MIPRYFKPSLWRSFAEHHARHLEAKGLALRKRRYGKVLRLAILEDRCQSVLDLGCGANSPVALLKDVVPTRIGVDGHAASVDASRSAGIHTDVFVANLLDAEKLFPPKSFDCVTLLEVIEHFSRSDGARLLAACERIARKKIVLSTPNGFLPQPSFGDNPFQEHLSGWAPADFLSRGYRVIGLAGWKPLRGLHMEPRWHPHVLFEWLSLLTDGLVRHRPGLASQLMCVKDIRV